MESYIQIAYLNDFIFCPRSIYFHQVYGKLSTRIYHTPAQIRGKAAHEAVDEKRYSTRKGILQGMEVYCEEYGVCGKIDMYDSDKKILTERKKHITKIYDGYIFQIYAQYFALKEMGCDVLELRFYSSDTNKVYKVPLPEDDLEMKNKFENVIRDINSCDLNDFKQTNIAKCEHCVYAAICDQALC